MPYSNFTMASPVFFLFIFFFKFSDSALLFPLSHTISTTHFNTTHHLLKSTTARSAARFRRHVSLPLSPGADYTLSLSLGSQKVSLYMDTGSDVVWLPCHPFECILCEGEPGASGAAAPLNLTLTSAARTTCKSAACSAVHSSLPHSDLCAIATCPLDAIETGDCNSFPCPPFYYAYGDGSFVARLYEDTLSVRAANLELPRFTFGCAHTSLAEPIGVAGFGRGPLSLPAQLSPQIGNNYFSYCLISHSFDAARLSKPSPLILGHFNNNNKKKKEQDQLIDVVDYSFTPMLDNPKHSYFYCVGLEGVSVGKRMIPAPESLKRVDRRGNGGMVVDSGTTYTMLPRRFYESVVGEFGARLGSVYRRARAVEGRVGLSPCYYGKAGGEGFVAGVPKLVLHFGGNSSVVMPRRNYFYEFVDGEARRKVGCLMMMDGGDEAESDGGPAGLLGNYQQQGFEVVYDLDEKRVGFAKRKCASLWDTLN